MYVRAANGVTVQSAALAQVAAHSSMQAVIVRAPLVYGAPPQGNLAALLAIADSPLPLPFAAIDNRRSFIALDDLCAALIACASVEAAAGRTYLVAHRDAVSTPRLLIAARHALGRPARLYRIAPRILEAMAAAIGASANVRRLTRSLEADPSRAERELGWRAERSIDDTMVRLARAWREARR